MGKEVVNNTKFNKPTKVNNLKGKIPYATILIHINQYNNNWRQKLEMFVKKIPDVSGLLTSSAINTNNGEVENKISDMSSLVTSNVLNIKIGEVQIKIQDTSCLVKKTDFNAKILNIEKKYFTTSDYNKFTKKILNVKIKEKGLLDKSNISNLVENSDLNTKLATLATKAELEAE